MKSIRLIHLIRLGDLEKITRFRIPREELIRKSIHLSAISVPLAYYFCEKVWILSLIVVGLMIAVIIEQLRRKNLVFQNVFYRRLGLLLRESERFQLTGATYLIFGSLICVLTMPKITAIFGLIVVIVADAMAGLVGRSLGTHRLYRKKSWEGTAAFFICTWFLGLAILNSSLWLLLIISGMITAVELFWRGMSDNLVLPVVSCLIVEFFGYLKEICTVLIK